VTNAALAMMECSPETPFPIRFTLPALAVLRRESDSGDAPFSLRLDLVDEDGRPAGLPRGLLARGVFMARRGLMALSLPFDDAAVAELEAAMRDVVAERRDLLHAASAAVA
jgi:hypothetical protein